MTTQQSGHTDRTTTLTPKRSRAISALLRSIAHPTRLRALAEFQYAELSPTELRPRLDDPQLSLATLAYHVRTLADGGLIELTGATPRRGAMEHHYSLTAVGELVLAAIESLAAADPSRDGTASPTLQRYRLDG
jgi:DNA-binding transcriptional ArsR family regulator